MPEIEITPEESKAVIRDAMGEEAWECWRDGHADLIEQIFQGIKPKLRQNCIEFAANNIKFRDNSSNIPMRFEPWPYQVEPLLCPTDPEVSEMVMCWASQTGKTAVGLVITAYYVKAFPSDIQITCPNFNRAKDWLRDKFTSMYDMSPGLQGLIRMDKRKAGNNAFSRIFPGGSLVVGSSGSPASLASRSCRFVNLGEVDRFNENAKMEGDPCDLSIKRAESFEDAFILWESTPTITGFSKIESQLELSDWRLWTVDCLYCRAPQVFAWEQVKWDSEDPRQCWIECSQCSGRITDEMRRDMVFDGRWVPSRPKNRLKRGYELNGINSLFPHRKGYVSRLHQMIEGYLEASAKGAMSMMVWTNTFLSKTYAPEELRVNWNKLEVMARGEEWAEGKVPRHVLAVTAGADIQKDRVEVIVCGWGYGFECWCVELRIIQGAITHKDTRQALDDFLRTTYEREDGLRLKIAAVCVDTKYNTKAVKDWLAGKETRKIFGIIGKTGYPPEGQDFVAARTAKKTAHRGARVFAIRTDAAKFELFSNLAKTRQGPGYVHFPKGRGFDSEFFEQLGAEKGVIRKVRGVPQVHYEQRRKRNEAVDLMVYASAAIRIIDPAFERLKKRLDAEVKRQRNLQIENESSSEEKEDETQEPSRILDHQERKPKRKRRRISMRFNSL